ncbi:hypothetical protein M199_gp201 [Halogranum tailed virus 1]|uniref:Uncharacterized protein n=1 Tax=Halogranum tailed virus 1 TaxID=1273749 RepID=R4T983_9CAUD|nr:hypothetical protein M199_gp201 [Halogranum tailed virus 1]AGM11465.1 hypothetical protein HGTV1_168 [Halogranum tailed virus 1]
MGLLTKLLGKKWTRGWMRLDGSRKWERLETHHGYKKVGTADDGNPVIAKYQIHEYYNSSTDETQFSGFKTGEMKYDESEAASGKLDGTIELFIMGVAGSEYKPLSDFPDDTVIR